MESTSFVAAPRIHFENFLMKCILDLSHLWICFLVAFIGFELTSAQYSCWNSIFNYPTVDWWIDVLNFVKAWVWSNGFLRTPEPPVLPCCVSSWNLRNLTMCAYFFSPHCARNILLHCLCEHFAYYAQQYTALFGGEHMLQEHFWILNHSVWFEVWVSPLVCYHHRWWAEKSLRRCPWALPGDTADHSVIRMNYITFALVMLHCSMSFFEQTLPGCLTAMNQFPACSPTKAM